MKLFHFNSRAEWLEWRGTGIGASEAGALFGVLPWLSVMDLWLIKTKLGIPKKVSPKARRGLDLEPLALAEYHHMTGIKTEKAFAQSEKYPRVLASLDGINFKHRRLVEVKCPGKEDHGLALSGKIPEKYKWQLTQQLLVTGYDEMDYFSFDGQKGVILVFKRNVQLETVLLAALKKFWEQVQRETPPEESFQQKIAKVMELRRIK